MVFAGVAVSQFIRSSSALLRNSDERAERRDFLSGRDRLTRAEAVFLNFLQSALVTSRRIANAMQGTKAPKRFQGCRSPGCEEKAVVTYDQPSEASEARTAG